MVLARRMGHGQARSFRPEHVAERAAAALSRWLAASEHLVFFMLELALLI